jgi:hypothetical protein
MKVGEKLNNGATVLMASESDNGFYVLAMWDKGPGHSVEFVTWAVSSKGNAFWGHYFRSHNLKEAVKDFERRIKDWETSDALLK